MGMEKGTDSKKGHENLISLADRSKKERREIQRKGGIKSGEVRQRKKQIKEILQIINEEILPENLSLQVKEVLKIDNPTYRHIVIASIYSQMLRGDMRAVELYLKLQDEFPKDNLSSEKSLTIIWNEKKYDTNEETE